MANKSYIFGFAGMAAGIVMSLTLYKPLGNLAMLLPVGGSVAGGLVGRALDNRDAKAAEEDQIRQRSMEPSEKLGRNADKIAGKVKLDKDFSYTPEEDAQKISHQERLAQARSGNATGGGSGRPYT